MKQSPIPLFPRATLRRLFSAAERSRLRQRWADLREASLVAEPPPTWSPLRLQAEGRPATAEPEPPAPALQVASQQAEIAHLQSLVLQLQEQVAGLTQTSTVATNTSFLGQEQTTSAVA